jgi:ankyrin repeat protein
MKRYLNLGLAVWACGGLLPAQTRGKVDFKLDVQPIFREYCVSCHGPAQQISGFRLDRRRDAMRGGGAVDIGPGNSAASRLYLKLTGEPEYGLQMPPTGPLSQEQIGIIKAWIDKGAEWPDDASGEKAPSPPDPAAARMMEALRNGNRQAFEKILRENAGAAKRRGPGGSTPLMYAALYGDARAVRVLLDSGADANVKNDAGATALMWAVEDLEKTRLLIEHGADPNARSDDGLTPLIIAANWFGSSPVLKILIDHGADPSAQTPLGITALDQAAQVGDEAAIRLLLEQGLDKKKAGPRALALAIRVNCAKCVELLIDSADRNTLSNLLPILVPNVGDGHDAVAARMLLDRGADANGIADRRGLTPLMRAAGSDLLPVETVQALIEHGADVNAKGNNGETALNMARLRGQTPVVELLKKAGATETSLPPAAAVKPNPAVSIRAAVQRSIPLLQKADVTFVEKSGCVSCHNNALTLMTLATAERYGIPIERQAAHQQLARIGTYLEGRRERTLQSQTIQGGLGPVIYILAGLASRNYPADETTDAYARFVKSKQLADGRWWDEHRPPLDSTDIGQTARAIRALQFYAPKPQRAEYDKSIRLAAAWLAKAQPRVTEDRAFQLLGLNWAGTGKETIRQAGRELMTQQRPDGGWAQLPTLASDAYATGEVLVALREVGALAVSDTAYQRGIKFLMNTQLDDGSWYVKSRSIPIQPYFESGFPHGHDQWISVSATNWAVMALAPAVEARR